MNAVSCIAALPWPVLLMGAIGAVTAAFALLVALVVFAFAYADATYPPLDEELR